ncbi:MAG: type II toxin-antitoxin system RelE/ParE family toxin [Candidatus Acidiferrum sp.]
MKPAIFHPQALAAIRSFPAEVRRELGKAIFDLQRGEVLKMPLSRPMAEIAAGGEELRIRDRSGSYRAFYFTRSVRGVLVFHAFVKKSQKTARREIVLGAKRLKELLMIKKKGVLTRTAGDLAKALGLAPADGAEIELRSELNSKIVAEVKRRGLTHAEVARLARSSRTRVTAILNHNTKDVSTDLLLRVLYALGWTARVKFKRAA